MLRPGGILLLIEFDLRAFVDGAILLINRERRVDVYGWATLADTLQICLKSRGIDVTVPERMAMIAYNTGGYSNVLKQHADIPIGVGSIEGGERRAGAYRGYALHSICF